MRPRIALIDDYQRVALACADWSLLRARAELHVIDRAFSSEDDAAVQLAPFDVVVAMRERTPFPDSLLARVPNLKLLVSTGPRNSVLDKEACARRGIAVCGTGGAATGLSATAEMAWALILGVQKRLVDENRALLDGVWQTGLTEVLDRKVLGVVGLGRIGERVARIGKAFGMRVLAWSPNLTADRASAAGVELASKPELFERADVVSLHLGLGEGTRSVVRREDLRSMQASAILVNTARGALIEPGALVDALRQGWISGAGLDVYDMEPLPPDDPLRSCPKVLMTPHLGYVTHDNYRAFYSSAVENILAWFDGRPLTPLA